MHNKMMDYRRLIGRFATGVAVITAQVDGEIHGMTVNSLTSVSLDPLLLLFCAKNESRTGAKIIAGGRFSVNILHHDQQIYSHHFAGKPMPNVSGICCEGDYAWISEASAIFHCEIFEVYDGGDHKIILGRVCAMEGAEDLPDPLLYYNGRYARMAPAHELNA